MENPVYVPIYVPAELAPAVYEEIAAHLKLVPPAADTGRADDQGGQMASLLAEDLGPARPKAEPGSSRFVEGREADTTWPDELLRRLYEDSNSAARALLDWMIDRPDEKCTTSEFAKAIGYTGPKANWKVPGVLGALKKRCMSKYGREYWPFAWARNENGEFRYWMPADVAAKLRTFRDGAPN